MIQLGAIAIPAIVASYIAQMVNSRISAAGAAQMAAAEFDYFQAMSESELTQISFQLAAQFPQHPYWEWFNILRNLRDYGIYQPPKPGLPQTTPPQGDRQREKESATWMWVAAAGVVAVLILWR